MASWLLIRAVLLLFISFASAEKVFDDVSEMPREFSHAIQIIKQKVELTKSMQMQNEFTADPFVVNQFYRDTFSQLTNTTSETFSNVTQDCLSQLFEFTAALNSSQEWALQGCFDQDCRVN